MKKEINLIKFYPNFQRNLFERVVRKYGSSLRAGVALNIPSSSIRAYKSLIFKSVSESIVQKLVLNKITSNEEIRRNIINKFDKYESVRDILNNGREKRNSYIKRLKKDMPKLSDIIIGDKLLVYKWFEKYIRLLDIPFRKTNFKIEGDLININYKNYTKNELKDFSVFLPYSIKIDKEFIYYLGLWCGDRSGGKRFGVCNKNQDIIKFVENFLIKYNQKVEKILYIKKGMKRPDIYYDKIFVFDKDINGWVLSVHSNNGIFTSFFNFLKHNLALILDKIDNKYPFFAGLFDAEGNVSLYNKSLRWACHDDGLIKIYKKHLKSLDLYDSYDGCCLISYNLKNFYKNVLPYMNQTEKINLTKFLYDGGAKMPQEYLGILKHLFSRPMSTQKKIAKALKKNKVYSELKLLCDFGYIMKKNRPYIFELTSKGLGTLGVAQF
jgi:hypothetical protein